MRTRECIFGLLLLTMGTVWHASGSEEYIRFIANNSTDYRIMVGPGISPIEEFAAQELQGYLMQISGVFLPMDRGNTQAFAQAFSKNLKRVLVGRAAIASLDLRVNRNYPGPDGFVIKTFGNKIILAGGSPRGTLYSVYAFLEMLGCRWLALGVIGEVIPQQLDITIAPIDYSERPSVRYRGFTYSIPAINEGAQWIDWMAKNRMNYLMVRQPNYADFVQTLGGELERRGMEAGVSFDIFTSGENQTPHKGDPPEAAQIMADRILEFLAANPEIRIVEVRAGHPEPGSAGILPASSDAVPDSQLAESIMRIAGAIHEQYPDKLIFLKARGITGGSLEKNLLLSFDPASRCYRHSLGDERCEINGRIRAHFEDLLRIWDKAHIHEHYMGIHSQNSLLFPVLNTIASDLEYFDSLGQVESVISQCEPGNWGTYGLNYYVFARIAWNTGDDLGSIVDDYCEKYYGSASEPMRRYFARLEDVMAGMEHFSYIDPPQLILKLLDEESLADLEREIRDAKNLANDATSFDRIRKTQLSFEHVKLLWHTLNHYFAALQFQKSGEFENAEEHFRKAAETGEKLVAFLFQNIDEGVFIIPEDYIFDYLEALIADARIREKPTGKQ